MAQSTEPKLKIPGESTTNPSFAAPQIQTAPDVGMSQKVAGIAPTPNQSVTPGASPAPPQATPANPPAGPAPQASQPQAPAAPGPETSNQGVANTPGTPAPLPITQPTIPPATTGGIPGVPNTAPLPPPVPVAAPPKALEGKNAAENDWITAQNENAQRLYEASLAFQGGPASALAQNTEKAEGGLRQATGARGAAGTIESSLYQGDKGRITQGLEVANLKAYNTYQSATNEANQALQKALVAWQRAGEVERKEIAEAAERRQAKEPVGRVGSTTPNVPGGVVTQVGGPPGLGGVIPREYRTPGGGLVRIGMPRR